jgi:phosphoribosylformimino-5-aminoimidazole carboxamide ribonucleotide (ProFAR) isomerase
MLIPSIDLMGGKIVQLAQGEEKKLEFSDFEYWIQRFLKYPLVQLIDLDAARGAGDNRALMQPILQRHSRSRRCTESSSCRRAQSDPWLRVTETRHD